MEVYTAQIIYRIICEGIKCDQYEEQWRIVFAADANDALSKAREIALTEETSFIDRHGRTICWQLLAIKSLQPVTLTHGTLLFSQVQEVEPVTHPVWQESPMGCS